MVHSPCQHQHFLVWTLVDQRFNRHHPQFCVSCSQCLRDWRTEAGTNYRGPAIRKGDRDPNTLRLFFRRLHKIAKSVYYLRHVCLSTWNISAPTGKIVIKFDIWGFFQNLLRYFKFHQNRTRIKGTLHEDHYTFFIISRSVLLRIKNVSEKRCRENQKPHFVFSNFFSKIMPFVRQRGKII
jgi:hypothetical protein